MDLTITVTLAKVFPQPMTVAMILLLDLEQDLDAMMELGAGPVVLVQINVE